MNAGIGNGIGFSQKNAVAGGGPPFQLNSAYNGLSVDTITGQIVLGDDLGFTGPADFVSDREINMQGFSYRLSQVNQAGFDNWHFEMQDNFMFMQNVGLTHTIYWTVDFAGNTGQFIGNDRTEPGWVPPFILMSDTGTGTFGRLQFNSNDAMELTDANPSNAIAIFQSGNVAFQPAGAVDSGWRFDIESIGNTQIMRAHDAGNVFLLIDQGVNYQFGNVAASNFLELDDALQNLTVNAVNGIRTIGDTVLIHSGTAYADGAAAALGTLTNAPAAGNPTKWIPIDDNGTTRFIPAW